VANTRKRNSPCLHPPSASLTPFCPPLPPPAQDLRGGTDPKIGFGAAVYPSSVFLALTLENRKFLHKKLGLRLNHPVNAVELGCGPGLAGIGLAVCGGISDSHILLSDGDSLSVNLARSNVESKETGEAIKSERNRVGAQKLLWGDEEDIEAAWKFFGGENKGIDLLIASDVVAVVYEKYFDDLLATIVKLNPSKILLTYRRRNEVENIFFKKLGVLGGWKLEKVVDEEYIPEVSEQSERALRTTRNIY